MSEQKFNGSLLNSVWRVCEKVRNVFETEDVSLRSFFREVDPMSLGVITENQFKSIIVEKLPEIVKLSQEEIQNLANYFRLRDNRIHYKQFCDVVDERHDKKVQGSQNCSLDWIDPAHRNTLSAFENEHLCILLSKIAQSLRLRDVVLRPYFEDYDLIAKNHGTVTFSHFYRVLHFLGIELSNKDYQLLTKKYMKDFYTVNYVAFINDIDANICLFDSQRPANYEQDIAQNYPGRFIEVKMPKIKRSEVETGNWILGRPSTCHPVVTSNFFQRNRKEIDVNEIFGQIQRHVISNKLNIVDYFRHFDVFHCGCVTKSQFRRGLDALGVAGINWLYLSNEEIERLCEAFADSRNPERINWKLFKAEIDCGYFKGNCSNPSFKELTQEEIINRMNCHNIVSKIQKTIKKKMFSVWPLFKDFDRHNNGHVTINQFYQVLSQIGTPLTGYEIQAIEQRYSDYQGFNYFAFLNDVEPQVMSPPKYDDFVRRKILVNSRVIEHPPKTEHDIVEILAAIKSQVVKKRTNILQFMSGFDPINHQVITCSEFKRGLKNADIILTENEMNVLCSLFKAPLRDGFVDYCRFCDLIEEVFTQKGLTHAPLLVPLPHIPSDDGPYNNLSINDRKIVSVTLQKLARYHDTISNFSELFENYDKFHCGTITKEQLIKILTLRDLHHFISQQEIDILHKCFGKERGTRLEFKYRDFLQALKLVANAQIQLCF